MSKENEFNYLKESLQTYLQKVSEKQPVPGGGSVTACTAVLSAVLLNMVLNYTLGKKKYASHVRELQIISEEIGRIITRLSGYIEGDSVVYSNIRKYTAEKDEVSAEKYLEESVGIHMDICELTVKIAGFARILEEKGNKNLLSDTGIAASIASSSFNSARLNVLINLGFMKNGVYVRQCKKRLEDMACKVLPEADGVYSRVLKNLQNGDI